MVSKEQKAAVYRLNLLQCMKTDKYFEYIWQDGNKDKIVLTWKILC